MRQLSPAAQIERLIRVAVCVALTWMSAEGANTSTITGKLVDAAGHPVAVALVVVSVRPASGAPSTFSTKSDATGAFSISSTVQGAFKVCVPASALYLDPCQWPNGSSTTGTTGTTASAAGVGTIALEIGAPLQIQLSDAAGLLASAESKGGKASILVGVWTAKGIFLPLPVVSKNAVARTHQSLVSTKTPLHVTITSPTLAIADGNKNSLPANGTLGDITVPPSGTTLVATITGQK
jgi:hypothetical protein